MERRSFLGAISAGLFGAKLPPNQPAEQAMVCTSFQAKKYTSNIVMSDEIMLACDGTAMQIVRDQMAETMRMEINREIMG